MYKRRPGAQLAAILQGLLDPNRSVGKSTHATFTSTSKRLALDVQELAWSLGARARISKRQTYFRDKNGTKKAGRPSWRVTIVHPDISSLFSLPRKLRQCSKKLMRHRL